MRFSVPHCHGICISVPWCHHVEGRWNLPAFPLLPLHSQPFSKVKDTVAIMSALQSGMTEPTKEIHSQYFLLLITGATISRTSQGIIFAVLGFFCFWSSFSKHVLRWAFLGSERHFYDFKNERQTSSRENTQTPSQLERNIQCTYLVLWLQLFTPWPKYELKWICIKIKADTLKLNMSHTHKRRNAKSYMKRNLPFSKRDPVMSKK